MYVEVGPRQVGKTTRLINAVISFLRENLDKTALIVAPTNEMRKIIQGGVIDGCPECEYRTVTSYKMIPTREQALYRPPTMKHFVDEFGVMKNDDLVVDKFAYYTSSYYPDYDPWPTPTESVNGFSDKAKEIFYTYNDIHKMNPIKNIIRHKL